jgi:leucyl/phenylalanyl-tRNA--protein transferase
MTNEHFLTQLDDSLVFPDPVHALPEPNGLLAIGGDLTPERMVQAYRHGIFPWYSPHQPILWWSPDPRGVLRTDQVHINRSLRKVIRKNPFRFSIDQAFSAVVQACAAPRTYSDETWISTDLIKTYHQLHQQGVAHSVEVWLGDRLVGGLYGLVIGKLFCGESMFHHEPNASKLAFVALCQHMQRYDAPLIDCQMENAYLETMGVQECPRSSFLSQLRQLRTQVFPVTAWQPQELDAPCLPPPSA